MASYVQMQAPIGWSLPVIPGYVMPSGISYTCHPDNIIEADVKDVGILLGMGFAPINIGLMNPAAALSGLELVPIQQNNQAVAAFANDLKALTSRIFAQTQTITVANSAVETNISGTGVGTLTLPANFFAVGKTLKISAFGFHSTVGNATLRIKIYLGSTVILDTGANASGNGTNDIWDIRAQLVGLLTGSSGTINGQGFYIEEGSGTNFFGMVNTAPITIDTTITQTLRMTVQWGAQSPSNSFTLTNLLLEVA